LQCEQFNFVFHENDFKSFSSVKILLAKIEWAVLWVWCEECCVNEQYRREWGRKPILYFYWYSEELITACSRIH
jgi:hypothetical protein